MLLQGSNGNSLYHIMYQWCLYFHSVYVECGNQTVLL